MGGEGVQIASYEPGNYYELHHDGLQRRSTVLLYLTDVAEGDGGETIFPMLRAHGVPKDRTPPLPPAVVGWQHSAHDFEPEHVETLEPYCVDDFYMKVRPEVGKAVIFFSY